MGDLVMVADSNKLKGKHKLGIIVATNMSNDGCVRSATVQYFIRKGASEAAQSKWAAEQVTRSVQRLSLILPVEEQDGELMVKDTTHGMQVCASEP